MKYYFYFFLLILNLTISNLHPNGFESKLNVILSKILTFLTTELKETSQTFHIQDAENPDLHLVKIDKQNQTITISIISEISFKEQLSNNYPKRVSDNYLQFTSEILKLLESCLNLVHNDLKNKFVVKHTTKKHLFNDFFEYYKSFLPDDWPNDLKQQIIQSNLPENISLTVKIIPIYKPGIETEINKLDSQDIISNFTILGLINSFGTKPNLLTIETTIPMNILVYKNSEEEEAGQANNKRRKINHSYGKLLDVDKEKKELPRLNQQTEYKIYQHAITNTKPNVDTTNCPT